LLSPSSVRPISGPSICLSVCPVSFLLSNLRSDNFSSRQSGFSLPDKHNKSIDSRICSFVRSGSMWVVLCSFSITLQNSIKLIAGSLPRVTGTCTLYCVAYHRFSTFFLNFHSLRISIIYVSILAFCQVLLKEYDDDDDDCETVLQAVQTIYITVA